MNRFDEQLLRLKQAIGVTKDTEVASALGMSRAAFSNRKRSQSFPDEKLAALKASHPDLDFAYILTGERWDAAELVLESVLLDAAAARGDEALAWSAARSVQNQVQSMRDALLVPQVRKLIGILVFCDDAAVDEVIRFAARHMGSEPITFASRLRPRADQRKATASPDSRAARSGDAGPHAAPETRKRQLIAVLNRGDEGPHAAPEPRSKTKQTRK